VLVAGRNDPGGAMTRYAAQYTTGVFRTDKPGPVEIDLAALAARADRMRRRPRA
jgi:hypothetical protein